MNLGAQTLAASLVLGSTAIYAAPVEETCDVKKDKQCDSAEAMERDLVIAEPAGVIERIKKYEALGYDEYSFWIDSSMSFERKKASLERFIKEVMPAFA